AAEADDGVDGRAFGDRKALFNTGCGRILADLIKKGVFHIRFCKMLLHQSSVPGRYDSGISYQQDLSRPDFTRQRSYLLDGIDAEHEACARLVIESTRLARYMFRLTLVHGTYGKNETYRFAASRIRIRRRPAPACSKSR